MDGSSIKVLAIDDNRDNLTTLRAVVLDRLPKATLLTASNGPAGLELARAEDPDVILLDILMPDMDGFTVCRSLKADERLRVIPVVFLTALRTDRESRIKAVEAGAEGFLSKPFDEIELIAQVRAMARIKAAAVRQRDDRLQLAELVAERTVALQESHDLLANLARFVPGVIYQYRLDPDGRSAFPYSSPGMNDIYEVTPEDVREDATPVFGRLHPDDHDRIVDAIGQSARTLDEFRCEFRVILPRQGLRWRWSQAHPERTQDGGTLWHGIVSDITERRLAEEEIRRLNEDLEARVAERTAELQVANRELETFSYSVSHDLRAPLRAISGFSELLGRRYRDVLDERGIHYLDSIADSSAAMSALIEALLDYSRLGRTAVRAMPVPLGGIVAGLRDMFGERISSMGATLLVPEPAATPEADPVLLERILVNLVDNALTYHDPSVAPVVTVSAIRHGRRVVLAVADNGIGIAPEDQERIFEPFIRLHGQDTYAGTGIGLAIVRKAAHLMGTGVTLTSTVGGGSTFSLSLPATDGQRTS